MRAASVEAHRDGNREIDLFVRDLYWGGRFFSHPTHAASLIIRASRRPILDPAVSNAIADSI
jgi:hypothetical protein